MLMPVLRVPLSQPPVMYHKYILRIALLYGLGEVKAPGNHRFPINDHDLVMSNRMGSIYLDRYPVVNEKGRRRILVRPLTLVQDDFPP